MQYNRDEEKAPIMCFTIERTLKGRTVQLMCIHTQTQTQTQQTHSHIQKCNHCGTYKFVKSSAVNTISIQRIPKYRKRKHLKRYTRIYSVYIAREAKGRRQKD